MQAEEQDAEREVFRMYRRQWFSYVNDISDFELQRRTWLDPANHNPHWSYIEFVSSFPDKDQLRFAGSKGFLTTEELGLLLELEQALSAHSAPNGNAWDNEAVLPDPAWHLVVEKAGNIKRRLLDLVSEPAERMHLLGEV